MINCLILYNQTESCPVKKTLPSSEWADRFSITLQKKILVPVSYHSPKVVKNVQRLYWSTSVLRNDLNKWNKEDEGKLVSNKTKILHKLG